MSKDTRNDEGVVYVDEDGNPIELEDGEEYSYVEEEVGPEPGAITRALNRAFHLADRGGSLASEIGAGIGMGLLAVCVVFLNMQIIGNALTSGVELVNSPQSSANISAALTYAQLYAGSIIVSVLGTLAIGIVANLPLVQLSTMGLASSLLCLVETGSGLTYENLLFVNLIAGVVYAVVVLVPGLRSLAHDAVPGAIRRGLPVATGLLFAWVALRMSGLIEADAISLGGGKVLAGASGVSVSTEGMGLATLIGIVIAVAIFAALRVTGRGKPALLALLGGTIAFILACIALTGIDTASTDSVANFGRVWLVAGSQASAETPFADSYLTYVASAIPAVFAGLASVLSAGADFSAYAGNAVALVASGVLCYLLSALFGAEGTLVAEGEEIGIASELESEPGMRRAKAVNALTNIVAPFLGIGAVRLSETGVAGTQDKAKTGIASIVAALVLLASLFVMVFPALFATETYPVGSMNQWNYFAYGNGGFVYLVRDVALGVADIVMACVGVTMALSVRRLSGVRELAPVVIMAIVSVVTLNIVIGVAAGMLVYLVLSVPARAKDPSALTVPMVVLEALLVATVILL